MLLLSWQLVTSIDFLPFTKIHQAAVLTHRFWLSMVAGRGTNTLRIHTAIIFSADCKHSAPVEGPQLPEGKQRCSLDFTKLAPHAQQLRLWGSLPASIPSPTLWWWWCGRVPNMYESKCSLGRAGHFGVRVIRERGGLNKFRSGTSSSFSGSKHASGTPFQTAPPPLFGSLNAPPPLPRNVSWPWEGTQEEGVWGLGRAVEGQRQTCGISPKQGLLRLGMFGGKRHEGSGHMERRSCCCAATPDPWCLCLVACPGAH